MHEFLQVVQTVLVIIIFGGLLVYILMMFLYRGKKKRITITNKRVSEYSGMNSMRTKMTSNNHYSVDCKYDGSDKLHTLGCDKSVYDKLNTGKSYTVIIKLRQIERVFKK